MPLTKYAFAPNVFEVDVNLMRHLQAQRRGFGFFRSGEDPKISDRKLKNAKHVAGSPFTP